MVRSADGRATSSAWRSRRWSSRSTGIGAANDFSNVEHDVYDFFTAAPTELDWLFRVGYWSLPAMVVAVIVGAIIAGTCGWP